MTDEAMTRSRRPTYQRVRSARLLPRGTIGKIDEDRIIRALMRGRFRIFNNRSKYVHNILSTVPKAVRPSNFLYADILEFLIRNRKEKIDYSVDG